MLWVESSSNRREGPHLLGRDGNLIAAVLDHQRTVRFPGYLPTPQNLQPKRSTRRFTYASRMSPPLARKFKETHLSERKLQETLQYFVVRGWNALGTPASDTGRGGNTGGFLCLHAPRHHVHTLQRFLKEGDGWMAVGYQKEDLHIAIIQLYLRAGENLQSPLNAEILANLFGFLERLKAPFISKAGYRIVAMVLHHGDSHHTGHFTTIHALDNTFWFVDNNQYPQPISRLTEQQEKEVLQLWLIHDAFEEEEEQLQEASNSIDPWSSLETRR